MMTQLIHCSTELPVSPARLLSKPGELTTIDHYLRIYNFTTVKNLNDSSIVTIKDIPENVTVSQYGAFWADSKRVYMVGGDVNREGWLDRDGKMYPINYTDATGGAIFSYDVEADEWNNEPAVQPNDGSSARGPFCCGSFAYNAPAGKAYFYSGLNGDAKNKLDPFNSPMFGTNENQTEYSGSSSLLTFDAASFKWSNSSLDTKALTTGTSGTVGGRFAFLPLTQSANGGIGVLIGGRQRQDVADEAWGQMESMREVLVYDTASDNWYRQPTTADDDDYPTGRWIFCMTAVSAPDNSSHSIYMYGGDTKGGIDDAQSDMWILTVPSFHWLRVKVDSPRRKGLACTTVGQRYMLTYGGLEAYHEGQNISCDSENHGLRLFDLSELEWTTQYDGPAAVGKNPYKVPKIVYDAIGGSEQGKATKTAPSAGFRSAELAALFQQSTPTETEARPSQMTTQTPIGKTNTGAIAGGVLGGLVGLAVILVGILCLLRRKQQQNEPLVETLVQPTEYYKYELHHEHLGELPEQQVAHHIGSEQDQLPHELPHEPIELPVAMTTRNERDGGDTMSNADLYEGPQSPHGRTRG
ncbi:uncharacterized protein N0V89_010502 [Didymosphaeria variabile]|uniref:Kelch repeat protein n=1 Tax=Didymosphaeria variabile TaxID=1932322 RepID=A0A9W8XBE2_9PLEO|nr:uncharacterized protein N0V89_010502 [Didymosphaeria variabile]KAJ4346571.1 hypothetical protein N0V89_010502 [Didymosphaeria variabile]